MITTESPSADIHKHRYTHICAKVTPVHLPDLWRWRYLIYLFVKRDFIVYFQQTILGPIWYLLQPLVSSTVLSIVFGRIIRLDTDTIPPFLFYFQGSIIWGYFTHCFSRISQTLSANTQEFGYASFPRLTVPVAALFSGLIQFILQSVLFCGIYCWYFRGSCARLSYIYLCIPAVVQCAFIGLGSGLCVASLTARYRDLSHLVGFCMQLLFFCTPVVYPLSLVPNNMRFIYGINPLTSVTELLRRSFFAISSISIVEYCTGWLVTGFLCIAGILLFNRIEKNYIDTT